jgi:hypothetical protein
MMLGGAIAFVAAERIAQVHFFRCALRLVIVWFSRSVAHPERRRAVYPHCVAGGALLFGDVVDVLLGYPAIATDYSLG